MKAANQFASAGGSIASGALLAVALALVPALAEAYIMPTESILGLMGKKRADIGMLSLVAQGSFQAKDQQGTVWEAMVPGQARRTERKSAQGTDVTLCRESKRWQFRIGEKSSAPTRAADLLFTFLGAPDRETLVARGNAFLRARGIDPSIVSLARLEKRSCYVIGAKPWDEHKSQLWVDKEFAVPARLIEVEQGGAVTDTRLLGWGSAATGEWYPQRIEVWKDGQLVESTTFTTVDLNQNVSEELLRAAS